MTALLPLLTALMPMIIKLLMYWLDYKNADTATKKKFLEFVESLNKYIPKANKLKQDYQNQIDENIKKIEELDKIK
jgi:hypothetical protein